jgi:hypothetical protein
MKKMFVGMIMLMMLITSVMASNYQVKDSSSNTIMRDPTIVESFLNSFGLMSIKQVNAQYKPGDTISVIVDETLLKDCTTGSQLIFEVYAGDRNHQTAISSNVCNPLIASCNYAGGAHTSPQTSIAYGGFEHPSAMFQFKVPSNAPLGTWSMSSYVYCPALNPASADTYSTVCGGTQANCPEFQVVASNPVSTAVCGNGRIEGTEYCDGDSTMCSTTSGYVGQAACNSDCKDYNWNACSSSLMCGDNIKNGPEACDGADLSGKSCTDYGFTGGTLKCKSGCGSVDVSSCTGGSSTKYACSGTSCVQSATGTFTSSTCNNQCTASCTNSQKKCRDGTCRDICPESSGTVPKFKVEILNPPAEVKALETVSFNVKITNEGSVGTKYVEAGILGDKTLDAWAPLQSLVKPATQCKADQYYVQSKQITLDAGESIVESYTVKVPGICSMTGALSKASTYDYYAGDYANCSNVDQGGSDQFSYDRTAILITPQSTFFSDCITSCNDGDLNNGESADDCGSVCKDVGKLCPLSYSCFTNDDCTSGYCSDTFTGTSTKVCRPASEKADVAPVNCPAPRGDACIPAGCKYEDYKFTVLGVGYDQKAACCAGANKISQGTTGGNQALAGTVTGATIGTFFGGAGAIPGTIAGLTIGSMVDIKLDYGTCEKPSFDFCQFNFIPNVDCNLGLIIEIGGILLLFFAMGRK